MYICMMKNPLLYKGILQPIVMQLLKDNGRMYGFEITRKVKEITQGHLNITEGALYPLLHRLEADALLTAEQEFVNNRMRKYYSLTAKGKRQSKDAMNEIAGFVGHLQNIFKLNPA